MKKPEFQSHILIVDTNILWHDDKELIANPEFQSFWNTNSTEFPIELAIPEVVIGELKYQHTTSASRAMLKATDALRQVSSVTGSNYKHRVTQKTIDTKIAQKFDKWCRKYSAHVIDVPCEKINWPRVVQDALWRRPPFEERDRKDRSEKGFRDSLILETISDFVEHASTEKSISFVCDDRVLREAADARLKETQTFAVFESLEEFAAYLRLTKEDLTNKFIKAILKKVARRFFKNGDEKTLYQQFDLRPKMNELAKAYISDPTLARPRTGLFSLAGTEKWKPDSQGRYWIHPPVFQRLESTNVYWWTTKVEFTQRHEPESPSLGDLLAPGSNQKLLLLEFRVDWKIKIGEGARLWDPELIDVKLVDKSFIHPTNEQVRAYKLEPSREKV